MAQQGNSNFGTTCAICYLISISKVAHQSSYSISVRFIVCAAIIVKHILPIIPVTKEYALTGPGVNHFRSCIYLRPSGQRQGSPVDIINGRCASTLRSLSDNSSLSCLTINGNDSAILSVSPISVRIL